MEHQDCFERLEKVLKSDRPELEVQRFLGVFYEGFGSFIQEKLGKKAGTLPLKETIQVYGERMFEEYMRQYKGV